MKQQAPTPEQIKQIAFSPAKLRAAREKAFPDYSLRRFAGEILNINFQRLSAYETGKDAPSPTMLAQLCFALKTDLLSLTE